MTFLFSTRSTINMNILFKDNILGAESPYMWDFLCPGLFGYCTYVHVLLKSTEYKQLLGKWIGLSKFSIFLLMSNYLTTCFRYIQFDFDSSKEVLVLFKGKTIVKLTVGLQFFSLQSTNSIFFPWDKRYTCSWYVHV